MIFNLASMTFILIEAFPAPAAQAGLYIYMYICIYKWHVCPGSYNCEKVLVS
jgi:hypothetical protein